MGAIRCEERARAHDRLVVVELDSLIRRLAREIASQVVTRFMEPRTQIGQFLARELSGDHVIASRPDHPQLFAGPDMLVGARGTLTAVFWRSSADGRSCNDVLARLTAARLALPSRTQCVLLIEPRMPEPGPDVFDNFNHQLNQHSPTDLARIIRGAPRASIREMPKETKQRAIARFSLLTQFTTVRSRTSARVSGEGRGHLLPSDFVNWWPIDSQAKIARRPGLVRKPKDVVVAEPAAVASKRWSDLRSGFLSRTRSLCVYSLRSEYELESGIPHPLVLIPNILALDQFPDTDVLQHKGIRALAFAGWATLAVHDVNELRILQTHLTEASRRRMFL